MRKLTVIQHMSLDGIIQGPGSAKEDRDGGFEFGGWISPYKDSSIGEAIVETHGDSLDLILGRRVYDIWSDYWPHQENNFAAIFNAATKYVITHRPESLTWEPCQAVGPDIINGVSAIKSQSGPSLICWGSSTVVPEMLDHNLVDELLLFVYPVLLGSGKTLYGSGSRPCSLNLTRSSVSASGVMIKSYSKIPS